MSASPQYTVFSGRPDFAISRQCEKPDTVLCSVLV